MNRPTSQQGAVAIYLALLVTIVILSGALLQSGILSQQVRFATDVLHNERAFYSSDSGIEAALFDLEQKIQNGDAAPTSDITNSISYGSQEATFHATGNLATSEDQTRTIPCVESTGVSGRENRRTAVGAKDCEP